jgi:hypothetical protein
LAVTDVRIIVTERTGRRMALARCPECALPARVNVEKLGLPVTCKNASCGLAFIVKLPRRAKVTAAPDAKKGR